MARVKNPVLFSSKFNLDPDTLSDAGLINPFLNVDTQLFIDPTLLAKSANPVINKNAIDAFRKHFGNFIRLLSISRKEGDAAWRGAERLLDLKEPPENGLGYGGSGRSGSSRPKEIRDVILRTAKEIIDLGSEDPEMISLMGFLEEGVGSDTISDFTTKVIASQLAQITEEFCALNEIPTKKFDDTQDFSLPFFLDQNGVEKYTVLVPRDIVRQLPIALDWSEIQAATDANAKIRDRVNTLLSGIAEPTVLDRKFAIRTATMESADLFNSFLGSIKDRAAHYDPNRDIFGYYKLKSILSEDKSAFKSLSSYDLNSGVSAIISMVHETISMFKHHIENGNLWEELWADGIPKRERAAQLIYYAMADCFCIANNIDISPEANMGGGPIDFKFSKGYNARVLVEIKRSNGSVVNGYEKQLEIYKTASRTFHGIFLVINFGDLGNKIEKIEKIRQNRLEAGYVASDIVVIDATPKASASKRK